MTFLVPLVLLLAAANAPTLSGPSFVSSRSDVTIRVDVPKDPRNLRLQLLWEGPVSGSTNRPHEGLGAPLRVIFDKELRGLPDGTYTLQAVLWQLQDGKPVEVRSLLKTLQVGQPPPDEMDDL